MAIADEGMHMKHYGFYDSPCGQMLLVAGDEGLSGVYFEGQKYYPSIDARWRRDERHVLIAQTRCELAEYFAGKREDFEAVLAPEGTPFQRKIWQAIARVGFGDTISYGELARSAGYPGKARAAGAATGRNPLTIIIPCHRIVASTGALTGYAGGLDRKRALLALESREGDLLAAA
jgi:methylated-DNA-[protein]-cysteine S-methyltransferase